MGDLAVLDTALTASTHGVDTRLFWGFQYLASMYGDRSSNPCRQFALPVSRGAGELTKHKVKKVDSDG